MLVVAQAGVRADVQQLQDDISVAAPRSLVQRAVAATVLSEW